MPSPHAFNGTTYHTLPSAADTGGTLALIHSTAGPFTGPPAHLHAHEDEVILVLEGEVAFEIADTRFTCGPLDVAFLPRGQAHSFRTGPQGARCLTIITPGGFEGFFADVSDAGLQLPRDLAQITALANGYGSVFMGPGLAQKMARGMSPNA